MNDTLISVVVPVYNVAAYLPRCVDSLLSQTHKNIEIILVNDGSTDDSPSLCNKYASENNNIKVIHKINGGLSSARNTGLKIASGSYIGFLDSDDWVSPNMYEELLLTALKHQNYISCARLTRVETEDTKTHSRNNCNIQLFNNVEYLRSLLLHKGDCSVCTKLFPSSIFDSLMFADGKLNEDFLFMSELALNGWGIAQSSKAEYYYFARPGSISRKYGKVFEDMVTNALYIKKKVSAKIHILIGEAQRFLLYQQMVFLLVIPDHMVVDENDFYNETFNTFKKDFFHYGILSKHLTVKQKLIMLMVCMTPRLTKRIKMACANLLKKQII